MKIAILGAGNIGLYIGGRLQEVGAEVSFFGRHRMHMQIKTQGLRLKDYLSNTHAFDYSQIRYNEGLKDISSFDIIILTLKNTHLDDCLPKVKSLLRARTKIIMIQNGINNKKYVEKHLPHCEIIEALVMFNVVLDNGVFFQSLEGPLVIEKNKCSEMSTLFNNCTFDFKETNNITGYKWSKLILNLNNAINALSGIPIKSELMQKPYRNALANSMLEAIAISRKEKINLENLTSVPTQIIPYILMLPTFIFKRLASKMLKIDPLAKSSMLMDIESNNKTEIHYINGEIVNIGRKYSYQTPFNNGICRLINQLENKSITNKITSKNILTNIKGKQR